MRLIMRLLDMIKGVLDPFGEWMKKASLEELEEEYERLRLEWVKNEAKTTGEKTPKMNRLNEEIYRRVVEIWKKDPRRSKDPNFRWTDANRWEKD